MTERGGETPSRGKTTDWTEFGGVYEPLQRATRTCELAGFGAVAEVDRNLVRMGLRSV